MGMRDGGRMPTHVRGGILVLLCIALSCTLVLLVLSASHTIGVLSLLIALAGLALGVLGTALSVRHH